MGKIYPLSQLRGKKKGEKKSYCNLDILLDSQIFEILKNLLANGFFPSISDVEPCEVYKKHKQTQNLKDHIAKVGSVIQLESKLPVGML